ncbi:hypothetical protein APY04_3461 [Hyphomicrobium sulfonivorans]|uniref:SAM-dependent methyltransferase, MidA n=1 Tax=Hyphomicrobium sulfonivorans TaxID=121290 RepID=A0A120CT69_HYPSL|nr:SAM-dependent methyltransferase [Hyphomicrobium sulfonivorans]KWT64197.1 hypothetical protein APY04_3461 [Hyphomicrobium sulfonivorans]
MSDSPTNGERAPIIATPLAQKLAARIRQHGPLPIDAYVEACLQDPEHGYYRKQTAIGGGGDFITAPEISQIFGELLGLWCALVWQSMGGPDRLRLIELGPGRGTLMADALRASRVVPAFHAALTVELVESNRVLVEAQRKALASCGVPVEWHDTVSPSATPTIVLANEFLDALALRQWIWRESGWHERAVGLDDAGALAFVEIPAADDREPAIPASLTNPHNGCIFESRADVFATLAAELKTSGQPFAGLFIDYGHGEPAFGDTLQALHAHAYADPLRAPGEDDLSALVDFAAFGDAARHAGFAVDGPVTQAELLGRLGIIERASRLMSANPVKAASIEAGIARLLAPVGMGTRFLALGIRSVDLSALPALEPVEMRPPRS